MRISQEELEKRVNEIADKYRRIYNFLDELEAKSNFWRDTQHDPHGIAMAVMVSLKEVRDAAQQLVEP